MIKLKNSADQQATPDQEKQSKGDFTAHKQGAQAAM
jgi:hypothetical protein